MRLQHLAQSHLLPVTIILTIVSMIGGWFLFLEEKSRAVREQPQVEQSQPEIDSCDKDSAQVKSIGLQADGRIYIAGSFNSVGEQPHKGLARLNADGTADGTFNSKTDKVILAAAQPDGKILVSMMVGSGYYLPYDIGGIARYNADGSLDAAFKPVSAKTEFRSIVVQSDGKILVGNGSIKVSGQKRSDFARLNTDGTVDSAFNPNISGGVFSIVVQPDGKILIGGEFTQVNGQKGNAVARLNPDGTLDNTFNPNRFISERKSNNGDINTGTVTSLAVQANSKILIGGAFSNFGGQKRQNIVRLNSNGTTDSSFDPNADGVVFALAVQSDGKILVGGNFRNIGGQMRRSIARLNSNGTADLFFNPDVGPSDVLSIAVQADNKILIGGGFNQVDGQAHSAVARLNGDGTLDTSFNPVPCINLKSDSVIK